MKLYAALFLITALLMGCDNTATEPKPKIFTEEVQALEKAKGVQQTIDHQAEDAHRNMDKAEQGQ